MKRILITGGVGFIGTNAAAYFLNKGYHVTAIDNFSRKGSRANANWLLNEFKNEPRLEIIKIDVTRDISKLFRIISETDVILHAAAQVAVTTSIENPFLDFEINLKGTLNVLEAARASARVTAFIFTSTNKVYGSLKDISFIEEATRYAYRDKPEGISEKEPLDFHSPYGCSKGAADQYVRDYHRIYGVPTIVFRQSCVYGPHQFGIVDQGWIAHISTFFLLNKPITIYGNGKQVRDILCVEDLNEAFYLAVKNINQTKGKIYNIGGGNKNTISVLELIVFLEKFLNKKVNVKFDKMRDGDQLVYISDTTKAFEDFNWKPKIDREQGLNKIIEWIDSNKNILG